MDQNGYTIVDENFKYKSRIITVTVKDKTGESREIRQKSVIYWSRHFYDRDVAEHKAFLEFIEKLKKSPDSFRVTKAQAGSLKKFMSKDIVNKETGEVSDYAAGNYLDANLIGSTIKGGSLYVGFKNNLITPNTYFMDEPIKIKNTAEKKSWKSFGNINEVDAIAYSSNVYMFRIAMLLGGAEYIYDGPLKINQEAFDTLRRDLGELGLGVKTGLDVPNEALGYRGHNRASGLLLDAMIGQYDAYTNIQLAQYACTLANGGKRVQPKLFLDSYTTDDEGNVETNYSSDTTVLDDVSNQATAFSRIKEGMRACVTRDQGTCHSYWSTKSYTTWAKTGTAEIYDYPDTENDYPNHLQIGYIAADESSEPVLVFACLAFRQTYASNGGSSSAPLVSSQVVDKYVEKYGVN